MFLLRSPKKEAPEEEKANPSIYNQHIVAKRKRKANETKQKKSYSRSSSVLSFFNFSKKEVIESENEEEECDVPDEEGSTQKVFKT